MAKIFISFVGMGKKDTGYEPAIYSFKGKKSGKTGFVQAAELELLGPASFDKVILLFTAQSAQKHMDPLIKELSCLGLKNVLCYDAISDEMNADAQWSWFECVLNLVDRNDCLVIDLTHGFRAISIVLSAALGFLQRSKNIELVHVLYGNHEKGGIIVDMKDFYIINNWAEAVNRLVQDADAGMLANLSREGHTGRFTALGKENIAEKLIELTGTLRNVDVNILSMKASAALDALQTAKADADPSSALLIDMAIEKFASLNVDTSAAYDMQYFSVQLAIIRLLLEHSLYMQAFTAMREFIGAIGILGAPEKKKKNMMNCEGREGRRYGNIFICMLQYDEVRWKFKDEEKVMVDFIKPFYDRMKTIGVEPILRSITKEMLDYRNAFDHAWVSVAKEKHDQWARELPDKGNKYLEQLGETVRLLVDENIVE